MRALKVLAGRVMLAGMLLQLPIVAVAQDRPQSQGSVQQQLTVMSHSPKIAQIPPPPPASPNATLPRPRYLFDYLPCVPEGLSKYPPAPQPLAQSPSHVQENPEERVQVIPRIQGSIPQIGPEIPLFGENQ